MESSKLQMEDTLKQAHVFISGSVQGVGFRQFVKSIAKKKGITGWVRNLNSEQVEVVLQGEEKVLEDMLRVLGKGPVLAEVKDVEVIWENPSEDFVSFEIR